MSFLFDEDVVLAKAANVRKCVASIRTLAGSDHAGVEEWIRVDVTVLNLQRALEALLDLANHLISANGWELPRDGRHAFTVLGDHGLLESADVALARSMVGFRNVAVHNYVALNPEIVRSIVRESLGALEGLLSGLLFRLRRHPAE